MSELKYRSEIDGLRAVAVISVVTFHASPESLPGGYVGVDIFFVISGFLICSIIAKSTSEGRFSLFDFYERRARRILPALVVMMAVVLCAGYLIMLPDAFAELGASAIATSLFMSNFFFWITASDYFAGPSEYAPLLHTWSLGVEEQFYIVSPLILFLAIRRHGMRGAFWTVFAVSAVSLAISIAFSREYASMSFYLPITRAHELGIGALLALAPTVPMPRPLREVLGMAGIAMMAAAILFYDYSTIFPGVAALLPCVGAGLVITAARTDTLAGRFLSLKPMVFVGLLSYSLYLWHWPLLALARHYTGSAQLAPAVALGCIAAAFLMAIMSVRYVETPFRSRSLAPTRQAVFVLSGGSLASAVVAGAAIVLSDGFPNRLAPDVQQIVHAGSRLNRADGVVCSNKGNVKSCRNVLAASGQPPQVIFIGDSHAEASAPFVLDALADQNVAAMALSRPGCPPLPEVYRTSHGSTDRECPELMRRLFLELDANPEVRAVVIHARWALYGSGHRPELEPGGPVFLSEAGAELNLNPQLNLPILQSRLAMLVTDISKRGRKLIIVGSVPEIGWDVPRVLASSVRFGLSLPDRPDAALYGPNKRGRTDAWLENYVADRKETTYVSVFSKFCASACEIWDGTTPYYSDSNHLSWRGAEIFSDHVVTEILSVLN